MLSVKNLSIGIRKSGSELLEDVNLELAAGKCLGLVGETGSGKSLTALSIMGLLPSQLQITQGQIVFDGKDLTTFSDRELRQWRGSRMSMIFQEPMTALNPLMRLGKQVQEVILEHRKTTPKEARKQVLDLFHDVRLPRPEKIYASYPHQISGGQKQRVMIAMAIANNPGLLIADEPSTALDVTVQKEILLLLKRLQKEYNMAMLFITHDLAVVSEIADAVAVMYRGKVVESGPVAQILKNPQHPYTQGLLSCHPPMGHRVKKLPTLSDFLNGDKNIPARETETDESRKTRLKFLYEQEPLLEVDRLVKEYPLSKTLTGKIKESLRAVNEVSFKVYPGETLGLVGESGCGKTTLGRSLLRLIDPDGGTIFYEKEDLLSLSGKSLSEHRKELNIVFQDPYSSLNPRLSIGEAILEPMQVHKMYKNRKERKEKVLELLGKVGLEESHYYRYPHEFSGGQRQRIVIARALALNPRFIVCDEAVSALDVSVQAVVLNLLNDLKAEFGFTYIFISHDLSVVRFMSDRIMVMKDGKIVETGDADEIYFHPNNDYTRQLIGAIPQLQH